MISAISPVKSTQAIYDVQLHKNEVIGLKKSANNKVTAFESILELQAQKQGSSENSFPLQKESLLNLSPQILDILSRGASYNPVTLANTTLGGNAANATTPFTAIPLTEVTITDIKNALVAAGFNPQQLSLQDILLALRYSAFPFYSSIKPPLVNEVLGSDLLDA